MEKMVRVREIRNFTYVMMLIIYRWLEPFESVSSVPFQSRKCCHYEL
jgi:hypothetical protein